jgi:hypothetical protein
VSGIPSEHRPTLGCFLGPDARPDTRPYSDQKGQETGQADSNAETLGKHEGQF